MLIFSTFLEARKINKFSDGQNWVCKQKKCTKEDLILLKKVDWYNYFQLYVTYGALICFSWLLSAD